MRPPAVAAKDALRGARPLVFARNVPQAGTLRAKGRKGREGEVVQPIPVILFRSAFALSHFRAFVQRKTFAFSLDRFASGRNH